MTTARRSTQVAPQSTPRASSSPHWLIRFMPVILIIWVAIIAGGAIFSPKLKSALRDESLAIEGSESYTTRQVITQEMQTGDSQSLVLVFKSDTMEVAEPAYRDAVQSVVDRVKAIDKVTQVNTYWNTQQKLLLGRDGQTTIALVQVDSSTVDTKDRVVPAMRELAKGAPVGLEIHVTGGQAVARDLGIAGEESSAKAEKVLIPVVLIVLLLIFGSGVSATLPLGLGIISVMVANGLFYFYARGHASHFLVPTMISMIGMGVGVDYSLFLVSRFREELATGKDRGEAVRTTIATSGKSILFSGATVLVSVASLYSVNSSLIRALVLSMVLVTLVAVLVSTTLLPPILYLLGHRINALRIPSFGRSGKKGGRFWHSWAHMVMRSPWVFTVLVMIPLLVISYPSIHMKTGYPNLSLLPETADARQGYEIVKEQFAGGLTGTIDVVVRLEKGTVADAENLPKLYALVQKLKADKSIDSVMSHVSLKPDWDLAHYEGLYIKTPERLAQLTESLGTGAGDLAKASTGLGVNVDLRPILTGGDFGLKLAMAGGGEGARRILPTLVNVDRGSNVARLIVVPKEGQDSPDTAELVKRLRGEVLPTSTQGLGQILVGGTPAQLVDFDQQLSDAMPGVITLVLVITFVVLLILLRSIVLPLKAIAMNLLSVGVAYGTLALVFEKGYLSGLLNFTSLGYVESTIILILFAVLFGLSMDYEVFLLTRVKEKFEETGDNAEALASGLENTAGIITGAATIMVLVFGAFAFTGIITAKEFGFGLAVAVLADATLIRILLVPALMRLAGAWNWWLPGWLERILPQVEVKH